MHVLSKNNIFVSKQKSYIEIGEIFLYNCFFIYQVRLLYISELSIKKIVRKDANQGCVIIKSLF
jgi:hypothetical protein